jgi:hypothetical protein
MLSANPYGSDAQEQDFPKPEGQKLPENQRMHQFGPGEVFLCEGFRLDRLGLFRLDAAGVASPVALGSRAISPDCWSNGTESWSQKMRSWRPSGPGRWSKTTI